MLHGTQEMAKMGGLAKHLKKTNILFGIGVLSMAGIPPLAIFFSKDLIIEEISSSWPFYLLGLAVSLLTAFYMTRAYFLTFMGKSHVAKLKKLTLKEAPSVMVNPVMVLGVLSVVGGMIGYYFYPLLHLNLGLWISIFVAFFGVGAGYIVYTRYKDNPVQFFYESFYINQLYDICIVGPMRVISNAISWFLEPKVFDASVQATAHTTYKAAGVLQMVQSGYIRSYISWIIAGTSLFLLYLVYEGF
jgi:NADH-quinone oxidoreductase subunit L